MDQLGEYDNLIKAIGALQYTSKYMANIVPIAFQAWKEMVFEKRANRIHEMLSSPSNGNSEDSREKQEMRQGSGARERGIGDQEDDDGLIEAEDDYEEYFFRDHGEGDQYVKLVGETPINPAGSFQGPI